MLSALFPETLETLLREHGPKKVLVDGGKKPCPCLATCTWRGRGLTGRDIVRLKKIEYGFRYITIRSPYTPFSIYLRGTI